MTLTALTALSPLDGRYASKVESLRIHFSEFGLIRNRIRVEIEWLKALAAGSQFVECPAFSAATIKQLDQIVTGFSVADADAVKAKYDQQLESQRERQSGDSGADDLKRKVRKSDREKKKNLF